MRALAIVEVVFLIVVWATIVMTRAYSSPGVPTDGRGSFELEHSAR